MDNHREKLKEALQSNDQGKAAELTKEYLKTLENAPLTIAITGESGSGKSTFVNALREIDNDDEGAAPTGVVETTMEPTEYCIPKNDNIKLWDLPGVGTTKFKADEYLKRMEFERYDFFIIISNNRFKENDAKLAQEIQKMGKKFYFVRSKIDHNIQDEKRKRDFSEEKTLKGIKDNCIKELHQLGIESPKVFLISSFDLHLYDFQAFWDTLEKELPSHQRNALLMALPNISLEVIKQKTEALQASIKWHALASATGAAVPIPGSSLAVDLTVIVKFVNKCQSSLGLTHDSLLRLSWVTRVPIEDIKAELKSPLAGVKITNELILTVLRGSITIITAIALGEGARFVPFLGIPFSMGLSGFSTYTALQYLLTALADDAQRVFTKAMGLTKSVEQQPLS